MKRAVTEMIDITKASTVTIGRRGEHHFRRLEFDVSSLIGDEYPGASLSAIYRRPDGIAYPVVTEFIDGVLAWSPNSADTAFAGVGQLEIRVTHGDVVGKSSRMLTIVHEALGDGIAAPPEPPAQEWLNQVLSALAALNLSDIDALLNLIHDQMIQTQNLLLGTRDTLYMRTETLLNHWHPVETATAPDMASRRASVTFTDISAGSNIVLGSVTYTFVTSLGTPAENNVEVMLQDTLRNTVKKLAGAVRGIQDEVNIAYGSATDPNPYCTAYWTSQRFSVGDTTVAPGESLFLIEKAEDVITALPLTSTAQSVINPFTRSAFLRYVMSGNASGSGGVNSVRGPLHTILPIDSVAIGGQSGALIPAAYDCHLITLCRQSDTSEKELDFYITNDETTFTRICRSTPIGADSTTESQHIHIEIRQSRVPAGYGLYVRLGSNGIVSSAYCDLKFTYHLYPASLATAVPFQF